MAAVDSFYLLYREIARSCNCYMEALALVGAWYTARKSITIICDFYSLIRLHFIPRLVSRADLIKQYGRWAVVSGATNGIGKAYAEELASRGLNIVLISQNEEKLHKLSRTLAETYKVETEVIVADFSNGRGIYLLIREALQDRDIGILVNNVGVFYPYPQYFTQVSEDKLWDIIDVNIAAASLMVHIVLPGMVARRKGAIVNISSGSCCKPTPQMTAYSASKAYLDHFSRALQYEYASKGIFVQSLIPFSVATNSKACGSFLHGCSWLVPSPKVYAHHAIATLGISKRTTGYWFHSIQFLLHSTCQNGSGRGEQTLSTVHCVTRPYPIDCEPGYSSLAKLCEPTVFRALEEQRFILIVYLLLTVLLAPYCCIIDKTDMVLS